MGIHLISDLRTRSAVDLIPNRCSPPIAILQSCTTQATCRYATTGSSESSKRSEESSQTSSSRKHRAAIAAITLIDHSDHETAERGLRLPNLAQRPLTPNLAQRPHTLV